MTVDRVRKTARRRYAFLAGLIAMVMLVAGFLLTTGTGGAHDIGLVVVGYGIGVAVAAVMLAFGWEPPRRKK